MPMAINVRQLDLEESIRFLDWEGNFYLSPRSVSSVASDDDSREALTQFDQSSSDFKFIL